MIENSHKKCPPVVCVSGLKNSGKTALIEAIIPLLALRGVRTAVIKHHGHGFEDKIPDKPGTDTYRFLVAGALGTVIFDDNTFMLVKQTSASTEDLVELFQDADLIIIEGAKAEPYPRIAMLRTGQPLTSDAQTLLCSVTDPDYDTSALPSAVPRFDFGDFEAVADFLLKRIQFKTV